MRAAEFHLFSWDGAEWLREEEKQTDKTDRDTFFFLFFLFFFSEKKDDSRMLF